MTLVTSDNHILRVAVERRMPVLKAEEFAPKLASLKEKSSEEDSETEASEIDPKLSNAEMNMWLDLFDARDE